MTSNMYDYFWWTTYSIDYIGNIFAVVVDGLEILVHALVQFIVDY